MHSKPSLCEKITKEQSYLASSCKKTYYLITMLRAREQTNGKNAN